MPFKDPEALRAYRKRHRAEHHTEILEKNRLYRETHREQLRGKARVYSRTRLQEICARVKVYYQEHREERIDYAHRYNMKNAEKIRRYWVAYYTAHPEKIRLASSLRRARAANAPVKDLTAQHWKEIKEHYRHRCVYCGKKCKRPTIDHITPLARGGSHTKSNVVPACKSCNSRKGARAPLCPVQPLLL
jgi:5-methylcytosine-specific restriction endonuclease McrA